jgi:hypothetical protein
LFGRLFVRVEQGDACGLSGLAQEWYAHMTVFGFYGVCDSCIAAVEAEYPAPELYTVAMNAKEHGRTIPPHRCRSPETCQCGCNWMDPETASMSNFGGWIPVLKCFVCGSDHILVNLEAETGKCKKCGCCWGGANFWTRREQLKVKE